MPRALNRGIPLEFVDSKGAPGKLGRVAGGQTTEERVPQQKGRERKEYIRYTRVRVRSGVDYYGRDLALLVLVAVGAEARRLLDAVHDGALVVGLEALEGHAKGLCLGFCRGDDVGEGR